MTALPLSVLPSGKVMLKMMAPASGVIVVLLFSLPGHSW